MDWGISSKRGKLPESGKWGNGKSCRKKNESVFLFLVGRAWLSFGSCKKSDVIAKNRKKREKEKKKNGLAKKET